MKFCTVLRKKKKKKKTPLKWYIILALLNANRFFFFKGLALEFKGNREQRWGMRERILEEKYCPTAA